MVIKIVSFLLRIEFQIESMHMNSFLFRDRGIDI